MADAKKSMDTRSDWFLANPWFWMVGGLAVCLGLWAAVQLRHDAWVASMDVPFWGLARFGLVVLGLGMAGGALTIRMNASGDSYLEKLSTPKRQKAVLTVLGLLVGLVVVSLLLFVGKLYGMNLPWEVGSLGFVFVVVAGVCGGCACAWFQCLSPSKPVTKGQEASALLILSGLCAFASCWALYLGEKPVENWDTIRSWDTIRMFLAVLTLVAFLAAPILLMPRFLQCATISLLVTLHFVGILHAVMAAPPAVPWTFRQTWVRVYRPYLLFMYINNAYHFYAPEPGPASCVWIYVFYEVPGREDSLVYYRTEFPRVNSRGNADYPMSLQYYRRLSFVDKIQRGDGTQLSLYTVNSKGQAGPNPVVLNRDANSLRPAGSQTLGAVALPGTYKIPLHPGLPLLAQYQKPGTTARELIESFARHVASTVKHPEYPDAKVAYVKIYRATHIIPNTRVVAKWKEVTKRPLTDLKNFEPYYYAYYLGNFSPEGKLLDAPAFDKFGRLATGDPMLYWLIPILNKNPNDLNSPIMDYVTYHATDGRAAVERKQQR